MVSINDDDFLDEFNIHDMTVGLVGFGYVGQAIESFFSNKCRTYVYDKYKENLDTLTDVVQNSQVVFVAVPTPMNKNGSCNTDIVFSVLEDIKNEANSIGRSVDEFVVVLKSTVEPGFTERSRLQTGLRLVFSPEFLTEANSIEDFKNTNRVLFGGRESDCVVVRQFFMKGLQPNAILGVCDNSTTLETVKLFANAMLATKVVFGNEMYELCQKLNIDYSEVMLLSSLDPRVGRSHLQVPGPDGDRGYGGHCFPKDIANLKYLCDKYQTKEKLISSVIDRNDEFRENRDWEKMVGRAVVEDE